MSKPKPLLRLLSNSVHSVSAPIGILGSKSIRLSLKGFRKTERVEGRMDSVFDAIKRDDMILCKDVVCNKGV